MCYDLLSMFQPNTYYDVQSCSPDKIFTRGIRQQEKVLVNLEHAG